MIVAQVYNPLAFACYQIGRPQSILMRIYLDILECTHYLLHMYFRQFFLLSMYFSSCKIPENQKSAWFLQFLMKFCLILATQWLPVCKRFLLQHIFVYVIIHTYTCTCCLWPEKDPFWFWGTKENIKLAAWTLHRFSAMKLNHALLYDDVANDMKRTFLIVWSKILDGKSWSYFDIELCSVSTLKRYNHHN